MTLMEVNVDERPALLARYETRSIPTILAVPRPRPFVSLGGASVVPYTGRRGWNSRTTKARLLAFPPAVIYWPKDACRSVLLTRDPGCPTKRST